MGMRYVLRAIKQTIHFSINKMTDIGCAPPFWMVLVSCYLHYEITLLLNISRIKKLTNIAYQMKLVD